MQKFKETAKWIFWCTLIVFALSLLIPVLMYGVLLGFAWVGDRVSSTVAKEIIDPKAEAYISQAYPDNDYILEDAYYVFKDNCYRVEVKSQSSQDTHFSLDYHYISLELVEDWYETSVLSGHTTGTRLRDDYERLIDDCLSEVTYLYYINSSFYGLDSGTLILDKDYDVAAMGSEYGSLDLTAVLPKEEVNIHSALEILLEVDRLLTECGIGYYEIEITIKDAEYPDTTTEFSLYDVHPEDLYREDALAYLQELWEAQEAHRQELKKQWAN